MGHSTFLGAASLRARVRSFEDILVHPSLEVLRNPGALFRGGPAWPRFETQILARTCWFPIPVPVDAKPPPLREAAAAAGEGVWCGPISIHFGHMLADFGMRLAASSRAYPDLPLIFSIWDLPGAEPFPFFWQIVDHLGIDRARIHLNRTPTLWRRLHVLPQAERRFGGGPHGAHLDFLDAITGPSPGPPDIACLFVSRAGLPKGRFAGEAVLETALRSVGVTVFRPETVPLEAQLALYRRARRLIVSEGSALHAFQLLGRLEAEMIVLCRRPWRRLAAASLRPRVSALHYVEALKGLVYGLRASGRPQRTTAPVHPRRGTAARRPRPSRLRRRLGPSRLSAGAGERHRGMDRASDGAGRPYGRAGDDRAAPAVPVAAAARRVARARRAGLTAPSEDSAAPRYRSACTRSPSWAGTTPGGSFLASVA